MRKSLPRRLRACACAGLLGVSALAHADPVFSCRNAHGEIAYQDHACAAGERQAEVMLDPAPPEAAPARTHERTRERSRAPAPARRRARGDADARTVMSWECRASDGAVFYRHGSCPKTIGSSRSATTGTRGGKGAMVGVTATPLPRAEACRRLAHAGGRSGREHDEAVSTYERNAGRDPCRRY
ncbi:MAG: DUF4124 domain-containing protein [Dokdonella sp.]|uniref:DUF4124 domain-containing protein n=1 Tax=Dokdonella sp. TaxID=2291710 RepID=UPI003F805116